MRFDWNLYKIYKAEPAKRMSAYLSKSRIPTMIQKDIIEDAIVDAILYNKDPFELCKVLNSKESAHFSDRVSDEHIDTKGNHIVDAVYTGSSPDMHTLICAVEQKFIQDYCTEKDITILLALMKYKTPMEVGKKLGITNILVSQRVNMIKEKYMKYKRGIRIKRFNNIGDRYEIDPTKLTTAYRKSVAELYINNVSYKDIATIIDSDPKRIASIIHSIRKR